MDVSLIMKTVGIGFLVSAAYILLSKAGRDEMAMLITVAGVVVILGMIINESAGLFNTVKSVFEL